MVLVVVDALTDIRGGAVVVVGMVEAVLWSAQAVLRNAATVGHHRTRAVQIGEHTGRRIRREGRGCDTSGGRIESSDALGHSSQGYCCTLSRSAGPPGGRTASTQFEWPLPESSKTLDREELRRMLRQMSLLSPRRAPGTPVLVDVDGAIGAARITVTPYATCEADALRLELTRRFKHALNKDVSTSH